MSSKEYTPELVAKSFIKQYYALIATNPNDLYRFYMEESSFTHAEGQQVAETLIGAESIRAKAAEFNLAGAHFDLSDGSVDAQKSENNGIFVLVTGQFTVADQPPRLFTQSFFLAIQKANSSSYYVRNSVLRVLNVPQAAVSISTGSQATAGQSTEHTQTVAPEPEAAPSAAPAATPAPEPVKKESGKKAKHHNQKEAAPVTASESSNPELIVDSVVVLIEDITGQSNNSNTPTSGGNGVVTIDDIAEVVEVLSSVVAAPSQPKSFADLFKSSSSPAASTQAQPGKKNNRSGSGGRAPRSAPAPAVESSPENSQPKPQAKQQSGNHSALFVKQIPQGTSEEEIKALFNNHGPVLKVNVNLSGSGFVDFAESNAAGIVLEKYTSDPSLFSINGQQISVSTPAKKSKPSATKGNNSGNRGNSKPNSSNSNGSAPAPATKSTDSPAVSGANGPKNAKKGRTSPSNAQPKAPANKK